MQSCAVKIGLVVLVAALIAGCGGGGYSSKAASQVGQVTLAPASISLVAGQVTQITASAVNTTGGAVSPLPTFTFNSSNTAIASVSPGGLVCGGAWDALFIVCNGNDSSGNAIHGSAVLTASAQGVSSAPVQVSVHPSVTSITVDPVMPATTCFSIKQTHQFTAHAFHNGTDVTNLIGTFTWTQTNAGVAAVDVNGVATAIGPGLTGVVASVGTVASPFTNFKGCMPVQIRLHLNGDPAGQPTETGSIAVSGTLTLQADMVDENNVTTNSAPVSIISNDTEVAQISSVTVTGESPGGAGILAACIPPVCGAGLNMPIYGNVFNLTVTGTSPATVVYATTSFGAPPGNSSTLLPIDTSKSPIVAGTPINIPGVPNSLKFNSNGSKGYLGTSGGLAVLDTTAGTITLADPFAGAVLAVSPDGNNIIMSNAANDPGTGTPIQPDVPSQRLVIFNANSNTVQSFVLPGAVSAAFTGDSFKAFIAANNGNVYVFSPQATLQTLTTGGSNVSAATIASGPYAYLANTSGLQVIGTCNNVVQPPANVPPVTSTPQLVGSTGNANILVAVNQTGLDIETATITSLTPPVTISSANCTPPVTYSDQFIDFAQGPFTARQLLVPTNGTGGTNGSHIVVLPVGLNMVLVAVPGSSASAITLPAGGTQALSGGMTLDGNTLWVGVAGANTVDEINLTSNSDVLQIQTNFKKFDGSPAPPNIVAVKPH